MSLGREAWTMLLNGTLTGLFFKVPFCFFRRKWYTGHGGWHYVKAHIPWLLVQSIKRLQRPILFLVILEPTRRVIWVGLLQKFLFIFWKIYTSSIFYCLRFVQTTGQMRRQVKRAGQSGCDYGSLQVIGTIAWRGWEVRSLTSATSKRALN